MANIGFSEDERNEFKETWSNSVPETLAAFANHRGGSVFIGVRKDGEVLGTDVSDGAQRQAADHVVHKLGLTCSIQAVEYAGRPVLRISIDPSPGTERVELSDEPGLAGLQRQEIWPYPRPALREMVVNALVHRDYATPGNIQIKVWNDQVLCWNPGELVSGLSIADIQQPGHVSRPRNPLIAQMFQLADLAEQWGTGTTRMIEECRDLRLPDPIFREESAGLKVTFQGDPFSPQKMVRFGLNDRQQLAIEHIRVYGDIANSEYVYLTEASRPTATRDLDDLVRRGILKREGSGRGRGVRYTLNRQ